MDFTPFNFLGLGTDKSDRARAGAVIVPVPYERTVSFRGGCARAPLAIIEASRSIELYDDELELCPSDFGIHTLGELECPTDPEGMVEGVRRTCAELAREGKFVIAVGGEHSVTIGALLAQREVHPEISVLSIDAHCDLRDAYQGSSFSHACVMRRALEAGCSVSIVGARSISAEEADFSRGREDLSIFRADEICGSDPQEWSARVLEKLGGKVYLSVDADGFDPSVMPAVGTPEPGGLSWREALGLVRRVFAERDVVAMDMVELSPIPGICAPEVACAKLIHKAVGFKFRKSLSV